MKKSILYTLFVVAFAIFGFLFILFNKSDYNTTQSDVFNHKNLEVINRHADNTSEQHDIFQKNEESSDPIKERKNRWAKLLAEHPYNNRPKRLPEEWKKIPKNDRPDLAMEQNVLMTMDPETGEVPYDRLIAANKKVARMLKRRTAISGVEWQERGPDNVGGRIRAMMFDPNDVTNKKVWAGGVGGGLWYTNDITATTPVWNHVNDLWDNIAISCIAYNPNNTQEFYVGTGEGWYNSDAQRGGGIWKTTDGGSTWWQLANTEPGAYNSGSHFQYVNKIVVKNDGTVFAATRGYYINTGGILRSTDTGSTWTRVLDVYTGAASLYDWAADIEVAANGDLYASFGIQSKGKVYKSTNANNGASTTWTDLSTNIGMANAKRIELVCAPSNSNVIIALAHGGSGSSDVEWIKRSNDGGTNWYSLGIPLMVDGSGNHFTRGQAFYNLILDIHPSDTSLVLTGGIDLHRSTDGGKNWTGISHWYGGFSKPEVHADQHAIQFRPGNSNEVIFANDGGMYYSSNTGNSSATPSFSSKNNSLNITQFYSCDTKNDINSHYFLAGSQDNGSQKFTQAQTGSTTEASGGDGGFCHIDQDNSDIQTTSYTYNSIYRSLDGGNSFTKDITDASGHFINPSEYDDTRNILYAAGDADELKRYAGFDATITTTDITILVGSEKISALKISSYNDVLFLGIANGRVYKVSNPSTGSPSLSRIDNGTTPITTSAWVSSIDIGASDNHIMVTYSNYGVTSIWETTDGGTNWYSKEGNLPDIPVRWALYNPDDRDEVMLATELGVWSTDDFGTGTSSSPDWDPTNTDLAHARCDMLKYRTADKMVVVATHGRGLYTSDVFATSSVADFEFNTNTSCTGSLTVNFTDASLKAEDSWAWDIDNDGVTDYTTQNPTHIYTSAGVYSVKLTINNGAASETKEKIITVLSSAPPAGCSISSNSNIENPYGFGIYNFELENINNTSSHNDGEYHDYSCSYSTVLSPNTTYSLSVTTGTVNNEAVKVYIDYNDDGDFTDSGEEIASFAANKNGTNTTSFTTPSTGLLYNDGLRLRVVSRYHYDPTSCNPDTYGQVEDYTVYFTNESTWDGSTDTDWSDANNWTPAAVPSSDALITIPDVTNQPVLDQSRTAYKITVEPGASITIPASYTLSLSTDFIIQSDASGTGSLINEGTLSVSGTSKVQRFVNGGSLGSASGINHYVSSPISDGNYSDLFDVEKGSFHVYQYLAGSGFSQITSGALTVGKGYVVAYDENKTINFEGSLNNGTLTTTISSTNNDWNLIGNPYPSAISPRAFLDENIKPTVSKNYIKGALYFWNQTASFDANDYATLNYTGQTAAINGGSAPDSIAVGQAFFVQSHTGGGASVSFKNDMRTAFDASFYTPSMDNTQRMWLSVFDKEKNYNEILIGFLHEASQDYDILYDAVKLKGNPNLSLYSLIAGNEENFVIQGRPILHNNDIVDIGIFSLKGGEYTIKLKELENFDEEIDVYLLDKTKNTKTDLRLTNEIKAKLVAGDNKDRFELHFIRNTNDIKNLDNSTETRVYSLNKTLYFDIPENKRYRIEVIDILGKVVHRGEYQAGSHQIQFENASGVVFINLYSNEESICKKLFVE
jgi:PKD repeat protein